MRSYQNKKGRWKWRECKGVKQVAKWVGKTDWDQAKVKAGGGRKQGRETKVAKDPVGRNDPLSQSGREEVGEW